MKPVFFFNLDVLFFDDPHASSFFFFICVCVCVLFLEKDCFSYVIAVSSAFHYRVVFIGVFFAVFSFLFFFSLHRCLWLEYLPFFF